jgi:hypothetical protein
VWYVAVAAGWIWGVSLLLMAVAWIGCRFSARVRTFFYGDDQNSA